MTSIAAFLAGLTGAAPAEGQKATPAAALGASGLFAALLESAGTAQGIEGETSLSAELFTAPPAPAGEPALSGAVAVNAGLDAALSQGLTFPEGSGDVDAAIVETGLNAETDLGAELPPALPAAAPEGADAGDAAPEPSPAVSAPAPAPRDGEARDGEAGAAPSPVSQPAAVQASASITLEGNIEAAAAKETAPVANQSQAAPQVEHAAKPENAPRPAGLETALERASQTGRENGLQTALSRATNQARGGETLQPGTAQDEPETPQARAAADVEAQAVKPGQARPEAAPRTPEIVQKVIRPASGQTLIQIQERIGGESAGASSPPTLTVSVQASTASPGPASASTPHVPVSALAVHIASQANNGARRFDIRLDPPELGRIEVRLDVSRKGHVTTHLVVERAETLDLLMRDARQLERALQDAGLNTSQDGMKFSLKDQGLAQGGDDPHADDAGGPDARPDDGLSQATDGPMPPPVRYSASAGLDIRI